MRNFKSPKYKFNDYMQEYIVSRAASGPFACDATIKQHLLVTRSTESTE